MKRASIILITVLFNISFVSCTPEGLGDLDSNQELVASEDGGEGGGVPTGEECED